MRMRWRASALCAALFALVQLVRGGFAHRALCKPLNALERICGLLALW